MNKTKIKSARTALLTRRDEIKSDLDRLGEEMKWLGADQESERGGLGNHLAEDGSSVMEQERISTMSADLQESLTQAEGALQRIDDGTYGNCQRCGKPINEERLEAFPYVPYCIGCQQSLERERSLYGT